MAADHDARPAVATAIYGPIERADLAGLCDRVCALLQGCRPATVIACDVGGVEPDAVTVDALARVQLAVQRQGCRMRLVGASAMLRRLVALMGLDDVLIDA